MKTFALWMTLALVPHASADAAELFLFLDEAGRTHVVDQRPLDSAVLLPRRPDVDRRPTRSSRVPQPAMLRKRSEVLQLLPEGAGVAVRPPRALHARSTRRAIRMTEPTVLRLRPVQNRPFDRPCVELAQICQQLDRR